MPVEQVWNFAKQIWRREIHLIDNFKNKPELRRRIELCIKRAPAKHLRTYVDKTKRLM